MYNFSRSLEVLNVLAEQLRNDLPIGEVEKLESQLKETIKTLVGEEKSNPGVAFAVAAAQKKIGLLYKYKSYGIKACTPLGYSIFLLNPGEGFSFQNHTAFKVELFHVLEVLPSGFLYTSTYEDWKSSYDPAAFKAWLGGIEDVRYDVHKIKPLPGDVVTVAETGVVHTAIGCVLEEYANISTDRVQRLHDQNSGKAIPAEFSRQFVDEKLSHITFPEYSSLVVSPDGKRKVLEPQVMEFGSVTVLYQDSNLVAARYIINPNQSQDIICGEEYRSLYVTQGHGRISLKTSDGAKDMSLNIKKGDPLLLVPGSNWKIFTEGDTPLHYSCLVIHKANALRA